MSVFLAPSSVGRSKQIGQFRAFFALNIIRQLFLSLSLLGALGILSQFFLLEILRQASIPTAITSFCSRFLSQAYFPIWLGMCVVGLVVSVASSIIARRLATSGGQVILDAMRDDPCECSLLSLVQQIPDGIALLHPTFRLGNESHVFNLVVVHSHGIAFIRTKPCLTDNPDVASIRAACERLSEQYSHPLLKEVRFIQLWEPKIGPDWQTGQVRDLGRFFPKGDGSTTRQEIAHSFRAVYNLAMPADKKAIPVQGTVPIPTPKKQRLAGGEGLPQKHHSLAILGKLILYSCLILFLGCLGVFLLQFVDYQMAERILVPTRAVLRDTLPADWQEYLRLGEEIIVDEKHIFAKIGAQSVKLSLAIGQVGQGNPIRPGIELQILQAREDKGRLWFLVSLPGATGWLPDYAVAVRHLLPKGSTLHKRPDINQEMLSRTNHDQPVAIISVWRRPAVTGEEVWSKARFLDRTIAYFHGEI